MLNERNNTKSELLYHLGSIIPFVCSTFYFISETPSLMRGLANLSFKRAISSSFMLIRVK